MKRKMLALDAFQSFNRESGNFNFCIHTDLVIIPICITSWPPKILGFVVKNHSSIITPAWRMAAIWLTLSARPPFQNFSTPCILNVNNTEAKQGSIMK
jgi:hypothetical protein